MTAATHAMIAASATCAAIAGNAMRTASAVGASNAIVVVVVNVVSHAIHGMANIMLFAPSVIVVRTVVSAIKTF